MQVPVAGSVLAQPINDNQLSDPRVRKAIAYAIDMETIVDTLLEGKAIRAVGILPNGPNKPDDLTPYDYDPEKARELLDEAGWDSSRELDVVYYYEDQLTADFMAAVQSYLSDVGIQMDYRLLEGDVGAQISATPEDPVDGPSAVDWDMLYGARAALAPHEYFNRFAEGQMPTIPNVPRMNEMVEKANSSTDIEVQREAFFEMERIINDNAYIIPLYYQQLFIYESDKLDRNGGPRGNEQFNYNWDVINWTVEPNEDGEQVMYTNGAPSQFFEVNWSNLGIFAHSKFAFDTILEADGSMTPIGGELAESYNVSEDGKTFTFTLRDDVTWHDGEPMTVEDVIWSIEAAALWPNTHPMVATTIRRIEGTEAYASGDADSIAGLSNDGNTITIEFVEVDPNVLLAFSQFAPLPRAHFEGVDPVQLQQAEFWQDPVGSGPFDITDVQMNDFTVLEPYQDYYKGTAKIDQIIALPSYDSDPNVLRNAAAGRADFGYTKNTTDVAGLEDMASMTVYPIDIPYTRMFWINQFPRD